MRDYTNGGKLEEKKELGGSRRKWGWKPERAKPRKEQGP